MSYLMYRTVVLGALVLLITVAPVHSSLVLSPLSTFERVQADHDHGVLLGTNHLVMRFSQNGKSHTQDWTHSTGMEWQIEEVTHGNQSLTLHLPADGPFAVRLPVGVYRVTTMRVRTSEGTWHTDLPTVFEIRPWECTSLGTSTFQMQVGFVTGWISRHILYEQEFSRANHDQLIGGNRCLISRAPLRSSGKHPVRLDRFKTKHGKEHRHEQE